MLALLVLATVVGGLLYAAWHTSEPVRIKRLLRSAQTYRIADLHDGHPGRIVGLAQVYRDHVVAPLSGRRCLYYVATIEQSKYGTEVWTPLASEEGGVPFVVSDASGRAIVDTTDATVVFDFDVQAITRTVDVLDDAQRSMLARQRIDPLHRTLRYAEAVLSDGERVAVLGAGMREPDPETPPESAYRGNHPTRLRIANSSRYPLVISDDPATTSD
jgi:hypothetical protein